MSAGCCWTCSACPRRPENLPAQPGPRPEMSAPRPGPASREARVIPAPRPALDVHYQVTPDVVALVDQLEAAWTARPRTSARAAAGLAEPEAGS